MQLRLVGSTSQPKTGFDEFWAAFPRKVGKGHARRALVSALRKTDMATILAGIEAYTANKPDYCDWCHPATWLNGERWDDEYQSEVDDVAATIEGIFNGSS